MDQNEKPFEITQVEIDFINNLLANLRQNRINVASGDLGNHMAASHNGGHPADMDSQYVNDVGYYENIERFCVESLDILKDLNHKIITGPRTRYKTAQSRDDQFTYFLRLPVIAANFKSFIAYLVEKKLLERVFHTNFIDYSIEDKAKLNEEVLTCVSVLAEKKLIEKQEYTLIETDLPPLLHSSAKT